MKIPSYFLASTLAAVVFGAPANQKVSGTRSGTHSMGSSSAPAVGSTLPPPPAPAGSDLSAASSGYPSPGPSDELTTPSGGQWLLDKGFCNISGLAWSGRGSIRRVDVSTDGGRNWTTARLETPVLSKALTRFNLPWRWDGKAAIIQSRAIDETGYVQPTYAELRAVRGSRSIYHNNSIQSWLVQENGEVINVQP